MICAIRQMDQIEYFNQRQGSDHKKISPAKANKGKHLTGALKGLQRKQRPGVESWVAFKSEAPSGGGVNLPEKCTRNATLHAKS